MATASKKDITKERKEVKKDWLKKDGHTHKEALASRLGRLLFLQRSRLLKSQTFYINSSVKTFVYK